MNKKIIFPKDKHAFVIQGTEKEKEQACIEIRDWAVKNNITMPAILTYESILNFRHCNYILWNGMCLDACLRNFSVVGYTIHYTVESFMKVFEVEESEPDMKQCIKDIVTKRFSAYTTGKEKSILDTEIGILQDIDKHFNKSTIQEFNPIELTNPKN